MSRANFDKQYRVGLRSYIVGCGSVVVDSLCNWFGFCFVVEYAIPSFKVIRLGMRELVNVLLLYVCVCVCMCVRACVRACVCVCVCVCKQSRPSSCISNKRSLIGVNSVCKSIKMCLC